MLRFIFELALKLGMPVGVMLRSMTAQELMLWQSLFKVKAAEEELARMKRGNR